MYLALWFLYYLFHAMHSSPEVHFDFCMSSLPASSILHWSYSSFIDIAWWFYRHNVPFSEFYPHHPVSFCFGSWLILIYRTTSVINDFTLSHVTPDRRQTCTYLFPTPSSLLFELFTYFNHLEDCSIHHIAFHIKFYWLSIVKSQRSIHNSLSFPSFLHPNFNSIYWDPLPKDLIQHYWRFYLPSNAPSQYTMSCLQGYLQSSSSTVIFGLCQ